MSYEVHIDWHGQTYLVGRVYAADRGSSVSFEYAPEWLDRTGTFAIDPTALPLQPGVQHSASLFGAIGDCGPDRWGRLLIERAVRKGALARKPYRDIDYVLALDDLARIGALRFRLDSGEPFLAPNVGKLPPLVRLNALLHATDAIHTETETAQDIRFLLGAGSPLGGARPKAAVTLPDGRLAMAKFPKPDDTRNIAAGEILALKLAGQAGIRAAEGRLVQVDDQGVAVITRFDRSVQGRIPFISAATLLGAAPGDPGSYTSMADGIRQFGDDVPGELRELWRRLVFSLLVSNYDDHLRNHGFLMHAPGRWALSPAYDINPVPEVNRVRTSKTAITENQEEPTVAGAIAVAGRFGLKTTEAKEILLQVFSAVRDWRKTARRLRLKASDRESYASAFEQPHMDGAGRLLGK